MKFKLDENLGASIRDVLLEAGHDTHTVREEQLLAAPDPQVFGAAGREDRILVTLDHDFGNVLVFRYQDSPGVAVINPPGRLSPALLRVLVQTLLEALKESEIRGRLWIVEPGRIREHRPEDIPGLEESE